MPIRKVILILNSFDSYKGHSLRKNRFKIGIERENTKTQILLVLYQEDDL